MIVCKNKNKLESFQDCMTVLPMFFHAAQMSTIVGSTPFDDLERGFHSEEFETLPDEMPLDGFGIDDDADDEDFDDDEDDWDI